MMEVITAPVPEPEPEPEPRLTSLPTPGRGSSLPTRWALAAAGLAFLLGLTAGAVVSPWRSAEPGPPSLPEPLEWLFTASLTYAATTEEGIEIPPPANSVTIREVEVLDPVKGPVLAIVELDHQTSREIVAYEITTKRTGRSWSVEAIPIADQRRGSEQQLNPSPES